jgi:hypothetical protein
VHLLGPFHGVTRRPTPTRGGGDSRRTNARRRDPSRARLRASTQPGPTSHRPATLVCYAAETREGHCGRHRKARALSSRGGCRSARAARP